MSFAGSIPKVTPDRMRQFLANVINELLFSLNYDDEAENHRVEIHRTHNSAWHIDVYQGANHYVFKVRMDQL